RASPACPSSPPSTPTRRAGVLSVRASGLLHSRWFPPCLRVRSSTLQSGIANMLHRRALGSPLIAARARPPVGASVAAHDAGASGRALSRYTGGGLVADRAL